MIWVIWFLLGLTIVLGLIAAGLYIASLLIGEDVIGNIDDVGNGYK